MVQLWLPVRAVIIMFVTGRCQRGDSLGICFDLAEARSSGSNMNVRRNLTRVDERVGSLDRASQRATVNGEDATLRSTLANQGGQKSKNGDLFMCHRWFLRFLLHQDQRLE